MTSKSSSGVNHDAGAVHPEKRQKTGHKMFPEKNTGTSGDDTIQHVLGINKQIHARPSLAMDRGQGLGAIFGVANTGSW